MGGIGEGVEKYGSDRAFTGNNVQGNGSDCDALLELELGSDGGDDEGAGRVPPSGDSEDCRYVISASRVGGWEWS